MQSVISCRLTPYVAVISSRSTTKKMTTSLYWSLLLPLLPLYSIYLLLTNFVWSTDVITCYCVLCMFVTAIYKVPYKYVSLDSEVETNVEETKTLLSWQQTCSVSWNDEYRILLMLYYAYCCENSLNGIGDQGIIQSLRRLSRLSSAVGLITATHFFVELQTVNQGDYTVRPRNYTVFQKNQAAKLLAVTLSNRNRFQKFFHWQTQQESCYTALRRHFTTSTPNIFRYTTLWNMNDRKTNEIHHQADAFLSLVV